MDQLQRAAIVLLGIGADNAAEVLRHMDHKEVQKLSEAMSNLGTVTPSQIQDALNDFVDEADQFGEIGLDARQYLKETLTKALGKERASGFLNRLLPNEAGNSLDSLKWMEPSTIADIIREEHPQVCAVALSHLESEQAAEVLKLFEEEQRLDYLMRVASLQSVSPQALEELNELLQKQMTSVTPTSQAPTLGGTKAVANILNALDSELETLVMDGIKVADNELAQQIQDQMFLFEDILKVDDRGIQTLLRELSSDQLVLAIKGADETVKEKILKNMSKRASEMLLDDLESKGPVRLSEVEMAQKEIIVSLRKLADSGEIMLAGRGEKFV